MWKCKKCGCENPNSCAACRICKEPATDEVFMPITSAETDLWKCKICGCENPNSSAACRICKEPAPGEIKAPVTSAGANLWKCKVCGCENPYSRAVCRVCMEPAPGEIKAPVTSGGANLWKCKVCGCENPNSYEICRICKTPAPGKESVLTSDTGADMWKCQICGCVNPNSSATCRFCKASAPGKPRVPDEPHDDKRGKGSSPSRLRPGILVAVAAIAIVLLVVGISESTSIIAAGSNETNHIVGRDSLPQTMIYNSNDALSLLHSVDDPDNGTIPEFEYDGEEYLSSGTGKVYRFNQTYNGIPVYGVQRVVSVDGKEKARYVAGDSVPGLEINMPSGAMSFDVASSLLSNSLGLYDTAIWNDGTCLFFEPNSGSENAYHLVYEIGFSGIKEDGQHVNMTALTDAQSGEIYRIFANDYTTERMTDDAKYNNGTFSTLYSDEAQYGSTGKGIYVLKDTDRGITLLDADNSDVIKIDDQYVLLGTYKYFTDADNDWKNPDKYADAVKLYQNLQKAYDFYTAIDQQAIHSPITALVGAAESSSWQGSEYFRFPKNNGEGRSLDIVGHEFSHFIVGKNLLYFDMPGALHESFADIMGALIENRTGEAFLSIGEDGGPYRKGKTIIRTLDSSKQDSVSNKTYSNMHDYAYESYEAYVNSDIEEKEYDNGKVHYNCGIPNMAFVYMSDYGKFDKAFSRDEIIHLYYNTMKSLYAGTEFWGARSIMLIECEELYGKGSDKYRAVEDAWDKVGVTVENRDKLYNWPHSGVDQLVINDSFTSSIDYQSDFDCLKFIPDKSGEYTFTFDHVNTLALNCYVLDSGMVVLGYDENIITRYDVLNVIASQNLDTYKEFLSDVSQLFSDNKITITLERDKTYYIVIKGYKNIGDYIVSARLTDEKTQSLPINTPILTVNPNVVQTPSNNIPEETPSEVKIPQTGSPVSIEEKSIYYDNEYVSVQISYPEISGLLDKELENEINTEVMQEMYNAIDSSEQAAQEGDSDSQNSVEASYKVVRNDGVILSMYLKVYCESGGAHGEDYTLYCNVLNTNQGVKLSISDLFIEGSDYISILNEKILKLIENDPNLSEENYFTTITANQDFYLTGSELIITFQKGDIAAYIEDQPVFRVPLNEISGMVVPWLK